MSMATPLRMLVTWSLLKWSRLLSLNKRDQRVPFEYPAVLGHLEVAQHILYFPFFFLWLFSHQLKLFPKDISQKGFSDHILSLLTNWGELFFRNSYTVSVVFTLSLRVQCFLGIYRFMKLFYLLMNHELLEEKKLFLHIYLCKSCSSLSQVLEISFFSF